MLDRFRKLLYTPRAGARITESNPWQLAPTASPPDFLRALTLLELPSATLALEGTLDGKVVDWLRLNASSDGLRISPGTLWPASDWWYLPLEAQKLEALVSVSGRAPPAVHLFVYEGERVLLEWYDAFTDPLWLSRELAGPHLERFVARVGGQLEPVSQSG